MFSIPLDLYLAPEDVLADLAALLLGHILALLPGHAAALLARHLDQSDVIIENTVTNQRSVLR